MTITANDIITLALKDAGVLGVGQTALAEDVNDSLVMLNGMIAQWQRQRYMVYHLVTTGITATGAQSYTVGAGGNFNIPRPALIAGAFYRQTNAGQTVDIPVQVLTARENYNQIVSKAVTGPPVVAYYDAAFPTGSVYFWPAPASPIQLFISTAETLQTFANLTTALDLPMEYFEALKYNLAIRIRPAYGLSPDMSIAALAKASMNVVRKANTQIPVMTMPSGLPNRDRFNIYSGG